jgi:ATP-dependent DNA ligase
LPSTCSTFDGHDLRGCAIEDRKALLRDVIGAAGCERIVVVDHVVGIGRQLSEAVRSGTRASSQNAPAAQSRRRRPKVKVCETAAFVITGYIEGEAVAVAELRGG